VTDRTLMVSLALGTSNAGLLRVAGELATRFDASVTGMAVCQPMPPVFDELALGGVARDIPLRAETCAPVSH